ncbi:Pre-mRNA splicing factor PRP21 like protein-domain-containing protein [Auriculariales sp. MPI-PUGE-AT-0066]|nr:Pre-mRNA splicing factor PRP21 like protein-domain-containing protein [Auriculariales sp. MPI-PUGE-AT-0066]
MSVAVATPPAPPHALNGGDVEMDDAAPGPRFASGMILPPPDIKTIADRTANWVAKSQNPAQFEAKIRQNQGNDPKFSFLNPNDPYHAYYRHRVERIAAGEVDATPAAGAEAQQDSGAATPAPQHVRGKPFPAPEFMLETPHISAVDLDTIKLTALFTARRGRTFLAALSSREGRNYQFDFLRPTHTLFGYFNRLVEQYTKVILPSKEMLGKLSELATPDGKWKILSETREYSEYERLRRDREKKREDDLEAERKAFAEIDWHDYVIVQTIEFTAADATSDLPVPMTIAEMENMTLSQKRMAAMITETAADDIDALRSAQTGTPTLIPGAVGSAAGVAAAEPGMGFELQDAEARQRKRKEEEERARELEKAKQIQNSTLDAAGPMKIRENYQPKLGRKDKVGVTMTECQICGQQVPTDEIQEHMRIELLDPKWKQQRDMLEARKAQASELQKGADVSAAFKGLARARIDIFGDEHDEEARDREIREQEAAAKQREKNVWDGHTASKLSTLEKYQSSVNFDEQIAAIHRAKGLTNEVSSIGPGIGPASAPPPMLGAPHSLPANPTLAGGVAAQAGPTSVVGGAIPVPPPAFGQPPPMMAPVHMGAPMGMHPARLAQLAGGPPQLAGQVRTADELDSDDMPPAKRQRVQKLPDGRFYPEADWVNLHPHPISLRIQLPSHPEKPEWKLDGGVITLPELPVTLLVSTLRDRIISHLGSAVSASKMRFGYEGRALTNAHSLAVYNLEDEDLLTLTIKDEPKKKK